MGLDIQPLLPDGKETEAFWPRQHLRYTWSHFCAIMTVIEHNAILTGVATEDDPTVVLIRDVKSDDTWTAAQCRDVHVLISKTFNASKHEPDPQALVATKECMQMVREVQQSCAKRLGVKEEEEEEDSMHLDEEEEAPPAW